MFPAKRMGDKTPSGYAFNYSMMEKMGICDLETIVDNQLVMDDLHKSAVKKVETNPQANEIEFPNPNEF